MNVDTVIARNNVRVLGQADGQPLVLIQGFGCDQVIWDRMLPEFTDSYKVVLFDHVGTGGSDPAAYHPAKYGSLDGYLSDLTEILEALDLKDAVLVGHTVAGAMALAASVDNPRIAQLVLLCTSSSYLNDGSYVGGFQREDIDGILNAVRSNVSLWVAGMAPAVTGSPAGSGLSMELTERVCRLRPEYVHDFLRMSLTTDIRHLLPRVNIPALILQTAADPLTPGTASLYLHEHLAGSTFEVLDVEGSMPHANSPLTTASAIRTYLEGNHRG